MFCYSNVIQSPFRSLLPCINLTLNDVVVREKVKRLSKATVHDSIFKLNHSYGFIVYVVATQCFGPLQTSVYEPYITSCRVDAA